MNRKNAAALLIFVAMVLGAGLLIRPAVSAGAAAAAPSRLFELRTYHTHPGKLAYLHARFRDHTNYLFVKHGITLVGYWVPDDQENTLVYMLAYHDRAARDTAWKAFLNDPAWKAAYKQSHELAGGPIVKKVDSRFLHPTDYSPMQ